MGADSEAPGPMTEAEKKKIIRQPKHRTPTHKILMPNGAACARACARMGGRPLTAGSNCSMCAAPRKAASSCRVPTRFVRSWIEAHYLARLRDHWQAEDPSIRRVDIELQPERPTEEKKPEIREQKAVAARKSRWLRRR